MLVFWGKTNSPTFFVCFWIPSSGWKDTKWRGVPYPPPYSWVLWKICQDVCAFTLGDSCEITIDLLLRIEPLQYGLFLMTTGLWKVNKTFLVVLSWFLLLVIAPCCFAKKPWLISVPPPPPKKKKTTTYRVADFGPESSRQTLEANI